MKWCLWSSFCRLWIHSTTPFCCFFSLRPSHSHENQPAQSKRKTQRKGLLAHYSTAPFTFSRNKHKKKEIFVCVFFFFFTRTDSIFYLHRYNFSNFYPHRHIFLFFVPVPILKESARCGSKKKKFKSVRVQKKWYRYGPEKKIMRNNPRKWSYHRW